MGHNFSKNEVEIDYFDKEIEQLNIYVCGNQKELINFNKQLEGSAINNEGKEFFQNRHHIYNWYFNFYNQKLTKELLENKIIIQIINDQKRIYHNNNNILLIFLDEIKNNENREKNEIVIEYAFQILENISKIYKPIMLFSAKKNIEEEGKDESQPDLYLLDNIKSINNLDKNLSKKYIEFCFYQENNYSEINKKLSSICCYYNNISDIFSIIDEIIKGDKSFRPNDNNIIKKYATFNIIVIGRPGGGKSTLINLLLNKRKAKEGIGLSVTRNVSKYIHDKYPITFQDTPGFENSIELKKMKKFLNYYNNYFKIGKNRIHLVLYVINASNERTFIGEEVDLINFITNEIKIPIFFICTKSNNEEYAKNFKEVTKLNILQNFGENTKLIDHIYCCHLLNEKDGIYKRFGIDIILKAIQEYFIKEINCSKFLGDINNTQDFINYLNSLSNNIIENYVYFTYKQEEKKNNKNFMRIKNDKINELMVDHLSLELNGNSTGKYFLERYRENIEMNIDKKIDEKIKKNSKDKDSLLSINKLLKKINLKGKDNSREVLITQEIGNCAKDNFLKDLKNIYGYDKYLNDLKNDYKKAINSITNLINDN